MSRHAFLERFGTLNLHLCRDLYELFSLVCNREGINTRSQGEGHKVKIAPTGRVASKLVNSSIFYLQLDL